MQPRWHGEFTGDFWPSAVGLVSCGVEKPNIFTLSVMGAPCSRPPLVTISPRPIRYSYRLLKETPQFVVNFPAVHMVKEIELCGTVSGAKVDKWATCHFTPIKGKVVDVPLIAECPVNLECVVEKEISFTDPDGRPGSHVLIIGRIVHASCHEQYFIDGHIQWDLVDTLYRSRPYTWRALGAVIGYDSRHGPPTDPRLAREEVNARVARLADLINHGG